MTSKYLKTSSVGSRITDIIVLTLSFLLFAMITEFESFFSLMLNLSLYVVVFFVCLRVGKRIFFGYIHSPKRCVNILFGNITGLSSGIIILSLIYLLFPGAIESMIAVVFASFMAFFILGTLSPMVKSSHNDIIPH